MSLVGILKRLARVGDYKCFTSLSKIEQKILAFVGILEKAG